MQFYKVVNECHISPSQKIWHSFIFISFSIPTRHLRSCFPALVDWAFQVFGQFDYFNQRYELLFRELVIINTISVPRRKKSSIGLKVSNKILPLQVGNAIYRFGLLRVSLPVWKRLNTHIKTLDICENMFYNASRLKYCNWIFVFSIRVCGANDRLSLRLP